MRIHTIVRREGTVMKLQRSITKNAEMLWQVSGRTLTNQETELLLGLSLLTSKEFTCLMYIRESL